MLYPNTIIELDAYFSDENKKRFIKLMSENFDIEEKDIDIYKANDYVKDSCQTKSSFSQFKFLYSLKICVFIRL